MSLDHTHIKPLSRRRTRAYSTPTTARVGRRGGRIVVENENIIGPVGTAERQISAITAVRIVFGTVWERWQQSLEGSHALRLGSQDGSINAALKHWQADVGRCRGSRPSSTRPCSHTSPICDLQALAIHDGRDCSIMIETPRSVQVARLRAPWLRERFAVVRRANTAADGASATRDLPTPSFWRR